MDVTSCDAYSSIDDTTVGIVDVTCCIDVSWNVIFVIDVNVTGNDTCNENTTFFVSTIVFKSMVDVITIADDTIIGNIVDSITNFIGDKVVLDCIPGDTSADVNVNNNTPFFIGNIVLNSTAVNASIVIVVVVSQMDESCCNDYSLLP